MSSDLSTGKTIFILVVVVGCFAVLWPKVFYPMLTASVKQSGSSQVANWREQANSRVLSQLCFLIEEQQDPSGFTRLSDEVCIDFVKKSCWVTITEKVVEDFRLAKDKTNLTFCLQQRFDISHQEVLSAVPPTSRTKPYQPQSLPHPHVRPERPSHLHPEAMHPALREKGRTVPHRTIEKQARPGPMPGIRPPMGGGGHMVPPQTKGSGAMGVIMPLYTVGIVIFFVYTIMKVLFKKSDDEDNKVPKLKDFHLDPEYRKYVFAEEYLDSSNSSHRDILKRQERENSKQRRRQDSASQPDTKIEDEQMDQLRRRLEETEKAMERLMSQMGSVTDKLTAAKITEVLSQAQTQARILKDAAEGGSDEDLTASEAFTNTLSEDFSLPLALQRHLEELKVKDMYLKGTSAGNFGSSPISPDELASPNEGHNSIQGSAPLIATNTTLLTSFANGYEAILTDKNSLQNGFEKIKDILNEETKEYKLDEKDNKQIPVVDFPLQVSSSLKQNLKNDQKQKEDLVLSSDIAQYDQAGGHSDREGSSDASETGADISELKSFADNGAVEAVGSISIPVIEEKVVPEVAYLPQFTETKETGIENVPEVPVITSSDGNVINLHMKSSGVEHGTQTEENKKLSVLNLRTTYQIDKKEQNKVMNIKEVEDKVNEIVLDATLPIDTQLLVKEAQTGSAVTNNIEIDASEIGSEPCVVTSQVSLAFVGMEHNDSETPYTFVVPDVRPKDSSDIKIVKIFQQPLQDKVLNLDDSADEKENNKKQEPSHEEKTKSNENKIEKRSMQVLPDEDIDVKGFISKSDNIIKQSTESDSMQKNYIEQNNERSKDCLDNKLTNVFTNLESGDFTNRLAQNSSGKDIDLTKLVQIKEAKLEDLETKNSNITLQSVPLKTIEQDLIDENPCISLQVKEKDEKNYSLQSQTVDNAPNNEILKDLDCTADMDALTIKSEEIALKDLISKEIQDSTNKTDSLGCVSDQEPLTIKSKELSQKELMSNEIQDSTNKTDSLGCVSDQEPLAKTIQELAQKELVSKAIQDNTEKTDTSDQEALSFKTEILSHKELVSNEIQDNTNKTDIFGFTSDQEALTAKSEELAQKTLISNEVQDNTNTTDNQINAGIIEIPKTISLESFDSTPELVHALEEPVDEEFIAIEFMRPESPVPPAIDDSRIDNKKIIFKYNENTHSSPETFKEVNIEYVKELANTLVEKTTLNALEHISGLPLDEISKDKNEAINSLESLLDTLQSKSTSSRGEISNQEHNTNPVERDLNLQSNNKKQVQLGKVAVSKDSESGGEKENMFVATVQCISTFSPPGSPFASEINTSFSLENINLTDHYTQSVTPSPFVEEPALKNEERGRTEQTSSFLNSTTLPDETIREQESAYRRSSLDNRETEMNHKG